jgi:hypothetical protein
VHRTTSRRQLKFSYYTGKAANHLDQRLGVHGPSDTPSAAIAERIARPSLAMSPMALSAMVFDLHRALRASFRADASCSWDAQDCSNLA